MRSLFAVMTGVMLFSAAAALATGWSWTNRANAADPALAASVSVDRR